MTAANTSPATSAAMNPKALSGAIPANELLIILPNTAAGFANDVLAVNQ
jgi:hypothetical protein